MQTGQGVEIKSLIRTIPDYPNAGIVFRDITTLLADPVGLRAPIGGLVWPFLGSGETRGVIPGRAVAHELGRGNGRRPHAGNH